MSCGLTLLFEKVGCGPTPEHISSGVYIYISLEMSLHIYIYLWLRPVFLPGF